MPRLIKNIFLPFLFLLLSVSPAAFINEDWFLLPLSLCLILANLLKGKGKDRILLVIISYWIFINLLSFWFFNQNFGSTFYTFSGSLMRIIIAYYIIKLGGSNIFENAERIVYSLVLIGLPLFFAIEFFSFLLPILKRFDVGSISELAIDGGWNILIYAYNPWVKFRFSGFAWEPGAFALILIFSLFICILREGYIINFRKILYVIALIFTFSTAGYIAFGVLVLLYAFNSSKKSIFYLFIVILLFIPLSKLAYKQEFMSGKIDKYIEHNNKIMEGGLESDKYRKLTRLEAVYLGYVLIKRWPIGYGISTKGRIKNTEGTGLYGSNALVETLIKWGVIGIIFLLVAYYKFFYFYYLINYKNKTYLFLSIPLLIMFFSNPVDRTPLFLGIILYSFIYNRDFKAINKFKKDG